MVSPTSERNIISICLRNNDSIIDVEGNGLYPEHFGVKANRYIYQAMVYLYSKQQSPTPMAISEVLADAKARKSLDEIGGLDYLQTLSEGRAKEDNLEIFCMKVKQSYTRRAVYDICEDTKSFVIGEQSEVLNPSEIIGELERKITDLSVSASDTTDVYKMGDETEEVLAERAEHPDTVPGLETGWTQFDTITNGGQPGDLICVVAESKTGKSVTLTNWATKFGIIDQIPVLYIDTEMNHREQEDRILSRLTGIPANEIMNGMFLMDTIHGKGEDKILLLKEAREKLGLGAYYHIYMPHFTIESVTAVARKFKMQFGIEALFFDYIKIPSSQGSFAEVKEYQALGFFTSGLKDIAGLLKIPVYTAAQTNRSDLGGTDKDATSIGGSYRILQLASKLMFLVNKTDEQIATQGINNGNQLLSIKYQRNGESDCDPINIMFHKEILYQEEV